MTAPRSQEQRLAAVEAKVQQLQGWRDAAVAAGGYPPPFVATLERDIEAGRAEARELRTRLSPEEYRARLRALTADQFRRYLGLVDEHGHAGALVVVEGEGSDG